MRHRPFNPAPLFAGLFAALLFATLTLPLAAQTAQEPQTRPEAFGYDKTREITLTGTIQEAVSQRSVGSPIGMHVIVTGSQGNIDAHLGPYLPKAAQDALHLGTPVQIVGAVETLHGKNYLLARQVIFGGQTVTIRNQNGFLLRPHTPRAARTTSTASETSSSPLGGGAQ
jgi:hypothetical protein